MREFWGEARGRGRRVRGAASTWLPAGVLVGVLVLSGCGTAVLDRPAGDGALAAVDLSDVRPIPDVPAQPPDRDGLQDAFDAIAAAFLDADPDALRPWLHAPESAFGQRWLDRAERLAAVPLAHYHLELDPSLPDLATASVRERYDDPVQVVYVVEEHRLEGFDDDGPASESLFLTMVRTPGGWRVAGDSDADPLGLVSAGHLWDHGPVAVTREGPLAILHHPQGPALGAILTEAQAALRDVAERWPLEWSERVPIVVPRDEEQLGDLLRVTFDLSNFVAFATATSTGELGDYELTGSRVVLNPDRFLGRTSQTRRLILAHELLHVATRPVGGPFVPSWLDEGVAQRLGEERSTTGLGLLNQLVASGRFAAELPDDSDFVTGGRDRIFLSYQLAYSFMDHLVAAFGRETAARFYAEVGRGSVGEPGRASWHVDRAARAVFGRPLDGLRSDWADALTPR